MSVSEQRNQSELIQTSLRVRSPKHPVKTQFNINKADSQCEYLKNLSQVSAPP